MLDCNVRGVYDVCNAFNMGQLPISRGAFRVWICRDRRHCGSGGSVGTVQFAPLCDGKFAD